MQSMSTVCASRPEPADAYVLDLWSSVRVGPRQIVMIVTTPGRPGPGHGVFPTELSAAIAYDYIFTRKIGT